MTFSGRGLMPGALPAHTLESLLPGVFLEPMDPGKDRGGPDFVRGFCEGLDCVLAPAPVTLDCLDAYFDPRLTPSDFLDWLAGWLGLSLDQNWPEERRRALVLQSGELFRWQGTVRGIVELVRLYTGVTPEVRDSGGIGWSTAPDSALPGSAVAELSVEVPIGTNGDIDLHRVEAIVAAVKPAHVPHSVKVVRRDDKDAPPPPPVATVEGDGPKTRPPLPFSPLQDDGHESPPSPRARTGQPRGRDGTSATRFDRARRSRDLLTYTQLDQNLSIIVSRPCAGRLVGAEVVGGDHQLPQLVAVTVDGEPPSRRRRCFGWLTDIN